MQDVMIAQTKESVPMDLLLLADPDEDNIHEYLHTGIVFIAKLNNDIVGALVMLKTRPRTMEIMNISVYEHYQNKGIGKKLIMEAIAFAKENTIRTVEIGGSSTIAMENIACLFRCFYKGVYEEL